jgi:prolipoprotein diacylglyceryltransferase
MIEFTLLFAVLTAVAAMALAARLARHRLAEVPHAVDILIGMASIGLFAGRIAAMVIDGVNPLTNPLQIFLVRAGVDTRVAALAAVGALAWTTRAMLPGWMDALAPVAVAGLAGWHGGCVWRGTCLGAASDVPWAYALEGSAVTRHPVELYAAAGLAVWAVVVAKLGMRPWLATGAAIAGVALIRLATEPIRPSLSGGPVAFYLIALLTGVGLVTLGVRFTGSPVSDPPDRPRSL